MRFRSGLVLTLAAGLALSGCAAGGAASGGPSVSPTGKTYEPGIRPTESRHTTPAKLYIAQGQYEQALSEAQQGVAADSTNPQHYFLLGQAHAGLGNYEEANEAFAMAERLYPAYELEIEPARESAWAESFNAGVEAYNAGNMAEAAAHWEAANSIYTLRPEGFQNLAAIYTQQGDYQQAIEAYRGALNALETEPASRVLEEEELAERAEARATTLENLSELLLFTDQYAEAEELFRSLLEEDPDNVTLQGRLGAAIASQPGREAEAQAIYSELLGRSDLDAATLMDIGVVLFQQEDYVRAAEAFERVTQQQPNSRDGWYNLANALYAAENWEGLIPVAVRLIEIDPLNYDASLMLARSYRDVGDNQNSVAELERMEATPIRLQGMQTQRGAEQTTVRGQAIGNQAEQGTPVRLNFTFYGEDGNQIATQSVTINAPARDETTDFEVTIQASEPVVGYSYQVAN